MVTKQQVEDNVGEPLGQYLRRRHIDDLIDVRPLAEEVGVAKTTVYNWLADYGIRIRYKTKRIEDPEDVKREKQFLGKRYGKSGESPYKLGEEIGVSPGTIYYRMGKRGIKRRTREEEAARRSKEKPTKEALERDYIILDGSQEEIAAEWEVSKSLVSKWVVGYGLKKDRGHAISKGLAKKRSGKIINDLEIDI